MVKRFGVLTFVLILVMSIVVGCTAATTPAETETEAVSVEAEAVADTTEDGSLPGEGYLVGVAMPTKSLQRWNQDGENLKAQLEAQGFEVDLQYADDDVATQVSQVENMVTKGADVLIIAAIDGGALGSVLKEAKEDGCLSIAYDRLIRDTADISYYVTFDNFQVGVIQGQYIVDTLGLADGETGPFNMEIFGGSPDDNNAFVFNSGAMSIVQPYIDNGVLVVKSGQVDMSIIAIQAWKAEGAQARMDNLLTAYYATENIDVVLSPNDSLAQGIAASLDSAGYAPDSADKPYPIVTGQDCDVLSMKNVIAGKQSMSIFKDTRVLADKAVEMTIAIVTGAEVPINNTTDYDNGVFVVPSFLCTPVFADINNYEALLIDSGYYTEDELQ